MNIEIDVNSLADFPQYNNDSYSYRIIKTLCRVAGINLAELVRLKNQKSSEDNQTTPQNLSNKLSRDTLKVSEFFELIDILQYDVLFRPIFAPESHPEPTFESLISEGYTDVKTHNFQTVLIAGKKCRDVKRYISNNFRKTYTEVDELILFLKLEKLYNVRIKPFMMPPNTQ